MLIELLRFLKREGGVLFWKRIAILATISGLSNAALLSIVNTAAEFVENEDENYRYFALYVVVFIIFFMAKRNALLRVTEKIEGIISNIRFRLTDKLSSSELSTIETIDTGSVFVRLTKDLNIISNITLSLSNAVQSIIMIFFALLYTCYISHVTFIAIAITMFCGILIYLSHAKKIRIELLEIYRMEDVFFHSVDGLLKGFKDLKVNSRKHKDFLKDHKSILDELLLVRERIGCRFVTNMIFNEIFLYILLASIVFIIPHIIPERNADVIKIVATTLFIIGPLTMTIALVPTASKASIAAKSLYDLELELDTKQKNLVKPIEEAETIEKNFHNIELKDLKFHYLDRDGNELFAVGPINLTIKRGELIFIVGGNGSGKSTFIKSLIGLYFPHKGTISVDGELIGDYNYQSYRDLFSIILTDFYIFKKLYGLENIKHSTINKFLLQMQLDTKTSFINNMYSNIDLSTGQRKRLALITSILENKDIYVFDEWAADQDPEFRKYFYTEILTTFKAAGKTIIAVTHDENYFHIADRVFKMEYGKLNEYNKKG